MRGLADTSVWIDYLRAADAPEAAALGDHDVLLGGRALAVAAARNYRLLRAKGITVRGTIDLPIATWCIAHAVPLLHADRDFTGMEKWLRLPRWAP